MQALRKPWVALVLALLLGGPGCFYVGRRRGVKATVAWLFALYFILPLASLPESRIFSILLLHAALAWKAYRSCKRADAEAGSAAVPAAGSIPRMRNDIAGAIGWGFAIMLISIFAEISFASGHYSRIYRSIHPGMTIAEVLHTVNVSGVITAHPQRVEGDGDPGKAVALSGPHDGRYDLLSGARGSASEAETVALLQRNIVSGCDYNIGFTFTQSLIGVHWTMTVVLDPGGRVKAVQPLRIWD